jgi:ferredoxin
MKVRVDDALCQGHGRCYVLAPDVFESDDHGHCIVLHEVIGADLEAAARTGADNCPEAAITLADD